MDNISQETRDFLIVAGILVLGGFGFLFWNSSGKPTESSEAREPVVTPSFYDRKITCKIDPKLKSFVKCDDKNEVIKFFQGEDSETPLFEIQSEELLNECEDRECRNVEIPKELKVSGATQSPRIISLIFPNYISEESLLDVIKEEFKKVPPVVGDEIHVKFLPAPENTFFARYDYINMQARIINYRRNKNKVIELFRVDPPASENSEPEDAFMGKERGAFYSFSDLRGKLGEYFEQLPDSEEKNRSISEFLQEVVDLEKSEKKQVVILGVDDTITFPKARSYPLDETGYSWFTTYQKRFNTDIFANNRQCTQSGYKGCKLKDTWDESFSEYYIRQNEEKILVGMKSKFSKDNFFVELVSLSDEEKDDFQRERDVVLEALAKLVTDKVTY
jgi:hypothetical protein